MARTRNPSYLQRRGNVWYATLDIPKALRPSFDGKPRFLQSLQTESKSEAERLKLPIIAGWKAEIEFVRTGRSEVFEELEQSALGWREGYMSNDPDRQEIASLEINERAYAIAEKDSERADVFFKIATGESLPVGDRIEEWLSSLSDTAKTTDMKRADLKRFAERFRHTHNVTKKSIRRWVQELQNEEGYRPATIRRIISPCRGYWDYLQRSGYITDDADPFEGAVKRESRQTKKEVGAERVAFTDNDIVRLVGAAAQRADKQLGQLIWLGMWTGCRIEELCSLRCTDIEANYINIRNAKSRAGNRQVPIHSRLGPLVQYLVGASEDGYILSGLSTNKYGDRSNAIGKRFGRLKKSEGFDNRHVFHSIRKTVATLLENAQVPEHVSADLLGHDKPTMTYGLYSGGTELTVRKQAIEKLSYPIEGTPDFLLNVSSMGTRR